jgi:hypothetical protein
MYDASTGALKSGYVSTSTPRFFAVKRWSMTPEAPGLNADNTEGKPGRPLANLAPGYAAKVRGIKSCRVRLEQATLDDSADPFSTAPAGAGFNIREGDYMKVFIWPDRDNSGNTALAHTAEVYVERVDYSGEVGGLQPVTIEGTSDGNYNFV